MKFWGKSVYTRFIQVLAIMVIMVILMGAYRIVLDSGNRKTASQKELELKNELFAKFEDNYATLNYVNNAIAALEAEISEIISEFHDKVLEIVNERLDDALNNITESYINSLFD